jgi:hypothetical protein
MIQFSLARLRALACALLCGGLLTAAAVAGPGAHGPNGEHLDAPAGGGVASAAAPRLEAKSDLFELVARLSGGELSIFIDRFESNEPLLSAAVEVESGAIKAKARFHADLGDYSVEDPALLKLLATPGEHPLVITVVAGDESDLLDGVLRTSAADAAALSHEDEFGHGRLAWSQWPNWARWSLGAALVSLPLLALVWRRKSKRLAALKGARP